MRLGAKTAVVPTTRHSLRLPFARARPHLIKPLVANRRRSLDSPGQASDHRVRIPILGQVGVWPALGLPSNKEFDMTLYRNLNGDSSVASYETTENSIHIVFRSGTYRNYLYDHSRPGQPMVDRMKALAAQGSGLNSYITTTVRKSYARKW